MYERIKRLKEAGRLDLNGIINAYDRGLINDVQFMALTGISYDEATGNKAGEGINAPKGEEENE